MKLFFQNKEISKEDIFLIRHRESQFTDGLNLLEFDLIEKNPIKQNDEIMLEIFGKKRFFYVQKIKESFPKKVSSISALTFKVDSILFSNNFDIGSLKISSLEKTVLETQKKINMQFSIKIFGSVKDFDPPIFVDFPKGKNLKCFFEFLARIFACDVHFFQKNNNLEIHFWHVERKNSTPLSIPSEMILTFQTSFEKKEPAVSKKLETKEIEKLEAKIQNDRIMISKNEVIQNNINSSSRSQFVSCSLANENRKKLEEKIALRETSQIEIPLKAKASILEYNCFKFPAALYKENDFFDGFFYSIEKEWFLERNFFQVNLRVFKI